MNNETYVPTKYELNLLQAIGEHPGATAAQIYHYVDHVPSVQSVMRFLHGAEKRGTIYREKINDSRAQCRGRSLKVCFLTAAGKAVVAAGQTRAANPEIGRQRHAQEFEPASNPALDDFLRMPVQRVG